ncbi:MAG: protein-L-isoaspartate(D-aspartate) O-methyltransferase [Pseudonocardia sp.]|nr:protein-L-isoaspartate(D-aspartate) O-methyltransferase [Pseudonocardia sp.]
MPGETEAKRRDRMIRRQLVARGIDDERVLAAMRDTPREVFVPRERRQRAYSDEALPIGLGQTISQPYIVALILQSMALRGPELVLEVGTGSGYSAALLSRLAARVVSIERLAVLAERARRCLAEVGAGNVEVIHGDGGQGWPALAPYDAIAVHALAPELPGALVEQLAPGGRLVIPLRATLGGVLTLFTRTESGLDRMPLAAVAFVPLISGEAAAEHGRRPARP